MYVKKGEAKCSFDEDSRSWREKDIEKWKNASRKRSLKNRILSKQTNVSGFQNVSDKRKKKQVLNDVFELFRAALSKNQAPRKLQNKYDWNQ